MAKIARFYGVSFNEVLNSDADLVHQMWLAITPLEAQEQMQSLMVQDYPYMKKADRTKVLKRLKKASEVEILREEPKEINPADLMGLMNG